LNRRAGLRHTARPAGRVVPSPDLADDRVDAVAAVAIDLPAPPGGSALTGRYAEAAVAAVEAHNRSRGQRIRRFAVSIGDGRAGSAGDEPRYRRVEVRSAEPAAAVRRALAAGAGADAGSEIESSDTILLADLGDVVMPGATRLEFYPVARGRSAVAFGAAAVAGGEAVLTIRARDLSVTDARALLGHTASLLSTHFEL
jgi:hypothetical protein